MAATTLFVPSPYFSFKWADYDAVTPYNTYPLENIDDIDYDQPVQIGADGIQSDQGQIQVISDFVPTCGLYKCNNAFVKDIPMVAIDPPILGVSFICYNGEVDFSDVAPGRYYCKITYTDELSNPRDWRTTALNAQVFHDGTQRFDVSNTANDKGAVFVNGDLTLQVIQFRVASILRLPLVKSDAQDYEDQYNELTQETSIPFITFTQQIGGPVLLPFWVIEKINLLYSLNQVLIDGQPFAKIAGQDFKPTRSDIGNNGAWWEVNIQPNTAYPSDVFATGDPGAGDYIVIKQAKTFKNQSADFAFTGNFTAGKNLIRLAIVNHGEDVLTLKVGTSDGDNSIGQFSIPASFDDSLDIGKLFTAPTDVWISGITGADLDITFDWNDYLAKNIIPGAPISAFAKNTVYYFMEVVPGSFAVEFDVGTGLGNVGTDHEGCVLAGTNGTPDVTGKVLRGWNRTLPLTRGTPVGADSIIIPRGALPAVGLNVFNGDSQNTTGNDITPGGGYARMQRNAGINRDYNIAQSGTVPDRGPTENMGNGDPVPSIPSAIILPAFYYVGV